MSRAPEFSYRLEVQDLPSKGVRVKLEADEKERAEFLDALGLAETGLSLVIHAGYGLLELITFFTSGPKQSRAWTVRKGSKAPQAAGAIHTDFERGFIRAETVSFDDLARCGSVAEARRQGVLRQEGKSYVVNEGDVINILFNV